MLGHFSLLCKNYLEGHLLRERILWVYQNGQDLC